MAHAQPRRQLLPRLVRLREAPFYLGMDRNRFSNDVRPYLTEIPIGKFSVLQDPQGGTFCLVKVTATC